MGRKISDKIDKIKETGILQETLKSSVDLQNTKNEIERKLKIVENYVDKQQKLEKKKIIEKWKQVYLFYSNKKQIFQNNMKLNDHQSTLLNRFIIKYPFASPSLFSMLNVFPFASSSPPFSSPFPPPSPSPIIAPQMTPLSPSQSLPTLLLSDYTVRILYPPFFISPLPFCPPPPFILSLLLLLLLLPYYLALHPLDFPSSPPPLPPFSSNYFHLLLVFPAPGPF